MCLRHNVAWATGAAWLLSGTLAQATPTDLWHRDCTPDGAAQTCVLTQSLSDAANRPLAVLRIALQGEGAVLQLLLPEGVHLASGAFYALDGGAERRLDYLRCRDGLCEASRALDAAEWRGFRRGKTLQILYRPAAGEPPADLPVSLTGITAAARGDKG